jgi:hypothetical protein
MGQTAYFPSEGRRAEGFFRPKNPTSSGGFEPTNLGTKDQHATSRPPKPLFKLYILKKIRKTPNKDIRHVEKKI